MTKRRRLLCVFGGLACLALLGTLLQYDRLVQLYLRHRLERHPEELSAYALSNDENKREAIRRFATTQNGAERTGRGPGVSEALLDTERLAFHRWGAAWALGRLRTPEAIAVLDRALALDGLGANLRAAVEKALDEARAR